MSNIGETASISVRFVVSTEDGGVLPTEQEFRDVISGMLHNGDTDFTWLGLDVDDVEVTKWDGENI